MAPGLMWAVIFHTQKNDLYLSQLADGPDERNHLERMSEAVSTYIRDLREQLPAIATTADAASAFATTAGAACGAHLQHLF